MMSHALLALQKKTIRFVVSAAHVILIGWLVFILIVLFSSLYQGRIKGLPEPLFLQWVIALAFLLVFTGIYLLFRLKTMRDLTSWWFFPGAIFFITILTRCAWLLLYRNVNLESDFALYINIASSLLTTGQVPKEWLWYVGYAPYVLGYSSFLALLMALFGQGVLVAQAANVILSGLIAALLFLIGKKINRSGGSGVIAAAGWVLLPGTAAMTSLPSTELPFITCMLAAIYACLDLPKHRFLVTGWISILMGAALIVLSNELRPLGILVLAALIVYLLFTLRVSGKRPYLFFLQIGVLLAVYFLSSSLIVRLKENFLGNEIARNGYSYGLYIGLNYETGGTWGPDDAALVSQAEQEGKSPSDFFEQMNPRLVERLNELVARRRLLDLLVKKVSVFWSNPNAFLDWLSVLMENDYHGRLLLKPLFQVSSGLYGALISLSLVEVVLTRLRRDYWYHSRLFFIKALLLGFALALAVYDNNARYIMPAIPLFCLLGASGLQTALDTLLANVSPAPATRPE